MWVDRKWAVAPRRWNSNDRSGYVREGTWPEYRIKDGIWQVELRSRWKKIILARDRQHEQRKLTHPWMVRVGVPCRNCLSLDFREKTKPGGEIWGAEEETGKTVFSSVTQSCQTLCNPVDCRMPGFPGHHQLPELAQTHVHWVGWCHPIISSSVMPYSCLQSFPTSGSFLMSQFFESGDWSIGALASVLPMSI